MNRRNGRAAGASGMSRRELVMLAGGAALARPLEAHAQPAAMPVVAFLGGASAQSYAGLLAAFQRGSARVAMSTAAT